MAQATGSVPLWGRLRLAVLAGVSRNDVGRGRDPDFPTALQVFSPSVDGLQGRFEFVDWGGGLVFDSRDDPSYARRGSVLSARVQLADGVRDTPHDYAKYELEAQHVRAAVGRKTLAGGAPPRRHHREPQRRSWRRGAVFRLERIGAQPLVRGYRSFRFTGQGRSGGQLRHTASDLEHRSPRRAGAGRRALFDFGTAGRTSPNCAKRIYTAPPGSAAVRDAGGHLFRFDNMWSPEGYRSTSRWRGTF